MKFYSLVATAILSLFTTLSNANPCVYTPPTEPVDESFFDYLIVTAQHPETTFDSIKEILSQHQDQCYQFHFKYPLRSKKMARKFEKILRIKAQKAHLFVPVIENSVVTACAPQGFVRQIAIANDGPTIQEHVLLNEKTSAVIFIEQWNALDGVWQRGSFAALNQIVEEGGQWWFEGLYLYGMEPTQEEIPLRIEMFDATYRNMLKFIKHRNLRREALLLKQCHTDSDQP